MLLLQILYISINIYIYNYGVRRRDKTPIICQQHDDATDLCKNFICPLRIKTLVCKRYTYNKSILVVRIESRFLGTEVDGSSAGSVSCVLEQDTLSALLQSSQL